MKRFKLLRDSYSGKLHAYWSNLTVSKQRVWLIGIFTLYTLICLFVVKASLTSNPIINAKQKQKSIRAVNYLLEKQKDKTTYHHLNQQL
ncbi:hypothetical protein LNQ81_12710 [Myroides sp. M-43]|uniref:hypothetical protein n=1 Tax=Myroides oncorhynchi TaxID=2893756 RepID=UPI001E4AD122|nr:hypothetical protein [Myroides oncorhynchi]MCC9043534.1 hypothetical protein [Myroides oncorhynchi]